MFDVVEAKDVRKRVRDIASFQESWGVGAGDFAESEHCGGGSADFCVGVGGVEYADGCSWERAKDSSGS